jgi:hypothetical protein
LVAASVPVFQRKSYKPSVSLRKINKLRKESRSGGRKKKLDVTRCHTKKT